MSRGQFSHGVQDEYYTPKYAVDIITPYIKEGMTVWCPFDTEQSKYVTELRENGNRVVATHIANGQDFLEYNPSFSFDVIVSNPPFSIKDRVLSKVIAYKKPFALLLPFTMFNSIRTVRAMESVPIDFIIMDRRISFNGERPNFTCWYVTYGLLGGNKVHIFNDDPRKLWREKH